MVDILKLRKMKETPNQEVETLPELDVSAKPPVDAPEMLSPAQEDQIIDFDDTSMVQPGEKQAPSPDQTVENTFEVKPEKQINDESKLTPQVLDNDKHVGGEQEQNVVDLVVFTLADRLFGVDIIKVQEVVRFTEITRVPNAAEFVLGVMNLRGNITPVIDLHKRFSLKEASWTDKTRIIVLQIKDQAIGFLVDHVSEIMHPLESDIESTTTVHANIGTDYISGVVKIRDAGENSKKLLILLNLEKIFDEGSITLG